MARQLVGSGSQVRLLAVIDPALVPGVSADQAHEVVLENETTDFRTQLESRLHGRPARQTSTAVDALGEVVWTQRYIEARVRGCSDEEASGLIVRQISGENGPRCPG